jgi:dipeptidyl aminopeptidase/acylaminoacyl peptidase
MAPTVAPYGTWRSPVTTALLVDKAVRLADPVVDGPVLYWTEGRPSDRGRQMVVRRSADGSVADILPEGFAARTRVHEYGGLCVAARDGALVFANDADQRLYRLEPGRPPRPLTPEPAEPLGLRYAAPVLTPDGSWVLCVRERHSGGTVDNELVAVPSGGDGAVRVVARGHDFVGTPALSPDGGRLAWCTWDHPHMPWDETQLWEAELGRGATARAVRLVAGGPGESITQPRYSPAGVLHFASDRSGWWNLYADDGEPGGRPLAPAAAEHAGPDWVFGLSSYALLATGEIVATWSVDGTARIGVLASHGDAFVPVETPYTVFSSVQPTGSGVVVLAASTDAPAALVEIALPAGRIEVVRASRGVAIPHGCISRPRHVAFPDGSGESVHALVYPPANDEFVAPAGERPPLVVSVHGGPTSSSSSALDFSVQYWTSRGFAVASVDYGGSSGYGRAYRQRLAGAWGVVDLADCELVARALVEAGEVDPDRLLVHGGSAGGFTVLCAATFGEVFAAGASYYGVADLAALARDTHKFESHYLDGLVGQWPEARALYEERSPLFHVDRLRMPLAIFQGLEDAVVPPSQAESIVAALRSAGVPVAYVTYPGEQHGFRRAESIVRTAEAELSFYGQVLGFSPAGVLDPVEIENADALRR